MTSRPLLISAILHMGVALLVVFGLPMIGRDLPEEMPIARMEIVQTVLETNLIEGNRVSTAKEEQEATVAKKPPPPPPPPPPVPPKVSPPAVKPEPAPEAASLTDDAEAEVLPDQPTTEVATLKVPRPTPKPKRLAKPKAEEVAKTDVKPSPKPTQPAPVMDSKPTPPAPRLNKSQEVVSDQLNKLVKETEERAHAASGVLQNLADAQVAARDAETARQTRQRKEAAETVTDTLTAVAGNAVKAPSPKLIAKVGLDDIGRIQQHVSRCWSAPVGADKTKVLIVDIFVRVNKSGSVIEARIDDMVRYGIDKTFRSFANRAQQAVVECSPLPIPPNKYDQLKEFIFAFDPRYLTKLN